MKNGNDVKRRLLGASAVRVTGTQNYLLPEARREVWRIVAVTGGGADGRPLMAKIRSCGQEITLPTDQLAPVQGEYW